MRRRDPALAPRSAEPGPSREAVRADNGGDETPTSAARSLRDAAFTPNAIAIVGASENPNKIGGRPLAYLSRFGFAGQVYAVNPTRPEVQGRRAYPDVASLPEAPDLAIVATPRQLVPQAVSECAGRGVRVAIVMASGFGETHDEAAIAEQRGIVESARAAGMRLIGPNSQGLANFASGAVASFSTMFLEVEPADGPVGIVSQSGMMSVVPYALLREKGIGVRHAHATGNDADVSLPELALAVVQDPGVRLLLLYIESIRDVQALAQAAALARERGVPIVAVKTGRTPQGQVAARSHTGALANEDRVVDAFFRRHGIWRARDAHDLVNAAELYLTGRSPAGRRLVVVSNSGAACVTAADAVDDVGLELASLGDDTVEAISGQLPPFATSSNPIDLTAALPGNGDLLGTVLSTLAADAGADQVLVSLPVTGAGYDVPAFAASAARFGAETGKPVAIAVPQKQAAQTFRQAGLPVFASQTDATAALAQVSRHLDLMQRAGSGGAGHRRVPVTLPAGRSRFLSEAQSLEVLQALGMPTVPYRLCRTLSDVTGAFEELESPVALKACSADLPHKSELDLVVLNVATGADAVRAFEALQAKVRGLAVQTEGVIVAPMRRGERELALGARVDPLFGPVLLIGDGGRYVEALGDIALLLPPVSISDVREALLSLRIGPALDGRGGEPPLDIDPFCAAAVTLGHVITTNADRIASIDLNPVIVGARGAGVSIVDALIERTVSTGATGAGPLCWRDGPEPDSRPGPCDMRRAFTVESGMRRGAGGSDLENGHDGVARQTEASALASALDPDAIAIIGASDNANEIDGRPLHNLSCFGYRGRVYPVNPHRSTVQGRRAFPDIATLPEAPDLAIIVTPVAQVEQAVRDCADRGVRTSVVMASGFGGTYDPEAVEAERRMVTCARAAGMRILGPNSQGLANFGTGTVASFSTMFLEVPPADGPVAIISQSGAMSVVPYRLLRERGIGVRHVHSTGNDSDITLPELALQVVQDPEVRLLLLYIESIRDPLTLAAAAAAARGRDVPIVAVKAGRTPRGQKAARSHRGALANDDGVVDAFMRAHGIWRARDVQEMVDTAELYLKDWRPTGRRLTVVSNSGAGCVMAADVVQEAGLELTTLGEQTVAAVAAQLPTFATPTNPIDLTAALLTNGRLFDGVLPVLASDDAVDLLLISVPVAGAGYDVPSFARAAADFSARTGKPAVVAATQESVAAAFRDVGVPAFASETRAIAGLAQLTRHVQLMRRPHAHVTSAAAMSVPHGQSRFLSGAQSLACLTSFGLPVTPFVLCGSEEEARAAFRRFGPGVLLKASSSECPRAGTAGFARTDVFTEADAGLAFTALEEAIARRGITHDGIIVAPIRHGRWELRIGAGIDPIFGPVVTVGDGGRHGNALGDAACLVPPVDVDGVNDALRTLHIAPLLEGVRGDPPLDVESLCAVAVALQQLMTAHAGQLESIELNPVVVGPEGQGLTIVEAVVERSAAAQSSERPVEVPAGM